MKKSNSISRRKFIAGALIIPALDVTRPLIAQEKLKLDENNASAAALGFKHNIADIDSMMFPRRETDANGATQYCNNCALFTTQASTTEWGGCLLFPTNSVASEGWCNVWAAKPA
jgi:hypothetical protein